MSAPTSDVHAFFDRYAHGRSTLDLDLIASQYAESFMMAGPSGARALDRSMILKAFTAGRALLEACGHTETRVASLDETRLDQDYVLVRAQFVWRFERPTASAVDVVVHSTFVLHASAGAMTIVFQLEHEDFQQALRASGVTPAQP